MPKKCNLYDIAVKSFTTALFIDTPIAVHIAQYKQVAPTALINQAAAFTCYFIRSVVRECTEDPFYPYAAAVIGGSAAHFMTNGEFKTLGYTRSLMYEIETDWNPLNGPVIDFFSTVFIEGAQDVMEGSGLKNALITGLYVAIVWETLYEDFTKLKEDSLALIGSATNIIMGQHDGEL